MTFLERAHQMLFSGIIRFVLNPLLRNLWLHLRTTFWDASSVIFGPESRHFSRGRISDTFHARCTILRHLTHNYSSCSTDGSKHTSETTTKYQCQCPLVAVSPNWPLLIDYPTAQHEWNLLFSQDTLVTKSRHLLSQGSPRLIFLSSAWSDSEG